MAEKSFVEGMRAEAWRVMALIFGMRQHQERERFLAAEQGYYNGRVQGPLDLDLDQRLAQQRVTESATLNGQVHGPSDPDQGRTRLDLLRDLHTEATGYRFAQAAQETQRGTAMAIAALEQRLQAQRVAQHEWHQHHVQYGQER